MAQLTFQITTPWLTAITPQILGLLTADGINGTWSPAINSTTTTTYTFTPSPGQCANTTTMTVVVSQNIVPTFTQIGPYCPGSSFTLPNTSNEGITGTWSPSINNNVTTNYTFTPSSGQCIQNANMNIAISSSITPSFTPQGPFCEGTNFSLPLTSDNGITGTWSPAINSSATTTYTFVPDAGQCSNATASQTIVINILTTPSFDAIGPFCQGEAFSLPIFSDNGVNGTWAPSIKNNVTTTYTFQPNSGVCANTTSLSVEIVPNPTASFSASTYEITETSNNVQFNNSSINATNYSWNFGDNSGSNTENPNHVFTTENPGNVTVTLIAFNTLGCSDTAQTVIIIKDDIEVYVPNAFTPDGDENNNIFKPVFSSNKLVYEFEMLVFDRWGELIFETKNQEIGWDGTYLAKGELCKEGVYVWKSRMKRAPNETEVMERVGHVNLLK